MADAEFTKLMGMSKAEWVRLLLPPNLARSAPPLIARSWPADCMVLHKNSGQSSRLEEDRETQSRQTLLNRSGWCRSRFSPFCCCCLCVSASIDVFPHLKLPCSHSATELACSSACERVKRVCFQAATISTETGEKKSKRGVDGSKAV